MWKPDKNTKEKIKDKRRLENLYSVMRTTLWRRLMTLNRSPLKQYLESFEDKENIVYWKHELWRLHFNWKSFVTFLQPAYLINTGRASKVIKARVLDPISLSCIRLAGLQNIWTTFAIQLELSATSKFQFCTCEPCSRVNVWGLDKLDVPVLKKTKFIAKYNTPIHTVAKNIFRNLFHAGAYPNYT